MEEEQLVERLRAVVAYIRRLEARVAQLEGRVADPEAKVNQPKSGNKPGGQPRRPRPFGRRAA
jgi:hypothetical protein